MGMICEHCKLKYCYGHAQAENHGCGEEAKKKARQAWLETGAEKLKGTQKKALNTVQKAQLQNKLKKKIEEKQTERQKKKPKDKK